MLLYSLLTEARIGEHSSVLEQASRLGTVTARGAVVFIQRILGQIFFFQLALFGYLGAADLIRR